MWRVWAMARRGELSICGLLCCVVFSPFSFLEFEAVLEISQKLFDTLDM
jgi:hypothetical protein